MSVSRKDEIDAGRRGGGRHIGVVADENLEGSCGDVAQRPGHIGGVPTQLALMMMDPEFPRFVLSCVVSILIGGAPASPDLVRQIRETFGVPVQVRYSSPELA